MTDKYNLSSPELDERFVCRAQSKAFLASQYFPDLTLRNAVQRLRRWINMCRPLMQELREMDYNPHRQNFLKQEVRAIVRHLGEP